MKQLITLALFFGLSQASIQTCFTPQDNCTQLIVNQINTANKSINVQAYSFTSWPILNALAQAESRGVDVNILLDKSNAQKRYAPVTNFLSNHSIPFLIDYKPAIAHNKVMIIDGDEVITGSFNFTKSAQYRNAENVIIIQDASIAKQYQQNFEYRKGLSESINGYFNHS